MPLGLISDLRMKPMLPEDNERTSAPGAGSSTDHVTPRIRVVSRFARGAPHPATPASDGLRVSHLLLLTALAGGHLAVIRLLTQKPPGLVGFAIVCVQSIVAGTAWTGLVIVLARRLSCPRVEIEPGTWLLVVLGGQWLLEILLELFRHFQGRAIFVSPQGVAAALACALMVIPLFHRRLVSRWKIAYLALAGLYCAGLLLLCAQILGSGDSVQLEVFAGAFIWARAAGGIAVVGAVVVRELWTRQQCGWLHWAGIAIWICAMLESVAVRIAG